ncbi:MAG TPA: cupin domain-containing protein [Ignavibacteriaceae bacterium]|nr:cupin domain-containing protein [Ignavibacteriaceae bacterium]
MDTKHVHQKENTVLGEKAEIASFNAPIETRRFPLGRLDLVKIAGAVIGRGIFEPGWRWSTSVKPIAKTESCEAPHFQYHLAGTLRIIMDDGTILDAKAGDVTMLPSGHDAYVIGDEAVVVIDFQGMVDYAVSK